MGWTVTSASPSPARCAFTLDQGPVFGARHKPRPDGIQADVAHGTQEVRRVQRYGGEAALEEMARPPSAGVDVVGIATMGLADSSTKGLGVGRHEDQMDMIRHQAVGPHLDACLHGLLGQQIAVNLLIAILEKDSFTPVAMLGHVGRKSRNYDPR